MKSKRKEAFRILSFIFLILFLTSIVQAELIIGETKTLYNSGDQFTASITIVPIRDASSFLITTLTCGSTTIDLFRSPYTLKAGQQKEVLLDVLFDRYLLGTAGGECFIRTTYDGEEETSQRFDITKAVDITLELGSSSVDPGARVGILGKATKENKGPLNGFVELTLPQLNISYTTNVKEGEFRFNFTIPSDTLPGSYELKAHAYEKDALGEIINEGETKETIKIKQLMTSIDIILSAPSIAPEKEITFIPLIYDQAGQQVSEDVGVTIYYPDKSIFEERLARTQVTTALPIGANYTPGDWRVEAKRTYLSITKTFFVEELKRASFRLENQTLVIVNTGNVPYDKPVEILIGTIREIKEVNLPVGASERVFLRAPAGEYTIGVADGTAKENLGTTFLTGKAISLVSATQFLEENTPILWILIIILLIAIAALLYYRKKKREKYFGKTGTSSTPLKTMPQTMQTPPTDNIIDKGEKQESAVVVIKIKNREQLDAAGPDGIKAIDSILWRIKEAGIKIYTEGEHRVIILAPMLTKEKDNTMKAISIATDTERMLNENNKRSIVKIDFGVGVALGDLIVESRAGQFRFTSVGNTIGNAKKIANYANNETLISEQLHRKTLMKVKAEKIATADYWRVNKITDRSEHEEFIQKFMQRQKTNH